MFFTSWLGSNKYHPLIALFNILNHIKFTLPPHKMNRNETTAEAYLESQEWDKLISSKEYNHVDEICKNFIVQNPCNQVSGK